MNNYEVLKADEYIYLFAFDEPDMVNVINLNDTKLGTIFKFRKKGDKIFSKTPNILKDGFIILHTWDGDIIFNIRKSCIETLPFESLNPVESDNLFNKIFFEETLTSNPYQGETSKITINGYFIVLNNSLLLPTTVTSRELGRTFEVSLNDDASLQITKKGILKEANKFNKKQFKDKLLDYEYDAFMLRRKKKDQR